MRNHFIGILLAFQFFSIVPIKKSFSLNRHTITAMYSSLPIVGLAMGLTLAGVYYLLHLNNFSTLFIAIMFVVLHTMLTGGLHLDGYVDVSDAFFSYQDRTRRLEILEDSRVGAFGAISLVILMLVKVAVMYEVMLRDSNNILLYIIIFPIITRIGIMFLFSKLPCAKDKGLAFYFKSNCDENKVLKSAFLTFLLFIGFAVYFKLHTFLAIAAILGIGVFVYRKFCMKHFGGITGDLLGAFYEGGHVLCWMSLLLFV